MTITIALILGLTKFGSGWRRTAGGWEYLRGQAIKARLTSDWSQVARPLLVDGVHLFRDVDGYSLCAYEGFRRLWTRQFDLGSPSPLLLGSRLLVLRIGRFIAWAGPQERESQSSRERRWRTIRKAERIEVLSAHGHSYLSASVYDVGEPRCLVDDRQLWTIKEDNARAVYFGSEGEPPARYSLCLRDATTGALRRSWRLEESLDEDVAGWKAYVDPKGREILVLPKGKKLVYQRGAVSLSEGGRSRPTRLRLLTSGGESMSSDRS